MTQIFISYARDVEPGEVLADQVQTRLQADGATVFRDVDGLIAGGDWANTLEAAIRSSAVVVLVLSDKVNRSRWVRREFNLAESLGLPVIPVLAEEMALPWWLTDYHGLDFSRDQDWGKLLAAVGRHLKHPHPTPSPSEGEGLKPVWAANNDEDEFGRFADLVVGDVVQRLRWVAFEDAPFWLADTACTQALWLAVTGKNPAEFRGDLERPVERVSWTMVQNFLQQLNGMVDGLSARLPTEAEWEFACRAGTKTAYAFGESVTQEQVAFNAEGTVAVKALLANDWGLYGMHGNAWEWCADDTDNWGNLKVLRGGCWANPVEAVRSDTRGQSAMGNRDYTIGFRFVVGLK